MKIKNANGAVRIILDNNGINVNNKAFYVDMQGNLNCRQITAFGISGDAVKEFSQTMDDSEAMQVAKKAISDAASAAAKAQEAAETANTAIANINTHIDNINNSVTKINGWITQLSTQIKELGKPGIS